MSDRNFLQQLVEHQGFVMLDGALATELEHKGGDLNDVLWSAKVLLESPELIKSVHTDYLHAGADVLLTASYQATFEGFQQKGIDRQQAASLMKKSVELAQHARADFWCTARAV